MIIVLHANNKMSEKVIMFVEECECCIEDHQILATRGPASRFIVEAKSKPL